MLIDKGAIITESACDGRQPLHYSSAAGMLYMTKLLVEEGGAVNAVNNDGKTALHMASLNGHLEVVMYLVQ